MNCFGSAIAPPAGSAVQGAAVRPAAVSAVRVRYVLAVPAGVTRGRRQRRRGHLRITRVEHA